MTEEELEKEAEKWLVNNLHSTEEDYKQAYLAGAEPREKQIQIDAEQIRALQKQNGELTDELKALRESVKNYGAGCYENGLRNGKRKLEAQIEKMKCCGNCIHCKYDENEESYEFCEKHQQVVNVAIVPCSEWKGR